MFNTDIEQEYYEWLSHMVGADYDKGEYEPLIRDLYSTSFLVVIPDDKNRILDGLELRNRFCEETNTEPGYLNDACSVLEMLIAMSMREEQEVLVDGVTNWTKILFWIMIENLELDDMTIDNYDQNRVLQILTTWMRRLYSPNGIGNIFRRAENRTISYKRIPFWQQMGWYVSENLI